MKRHLWNAAAADEAPSGDRLTDYDKAHLTVYLRLLDALSAGAAIDEMATAIFGIDPQREPERARNAVTTHLHRAQWMMAQGYQHLLRR